MRKLTYGGAISLDGYLATVDDGVDWLMWCDEAAEVMNDYWKGIDAILMGRRTYEVAMKSQPDGANSPNPYGDMSTYVFSRTLSPDDVKGAELVSENADDFVRELKEKPGKEICLMGGGLLASSLFDAGLIDEIGFNIHPVVLGDGIPAFPSGMRRSDLELIESRPFSNGCVYSMYRVISQE